MKRISRFIADHGRQIALFASGTLLAAFLLIYKLATLPGGSSVRELAFAQQNSDFTALLHDPIALPLSLLHWLLGLLPVDGITLQRLPSVTVALLAIGSITYVLRRWYGPRTALFGFALFASSAWVLHVGRLGTADVLLVAALPLLLLGHVLLHDYPDNRFVGYVWLAIQLGLLYIPGMIWFVLVNAFWQRAEFIEMLHSGKTLLNRIGQSLLVLILLVPLCLGLIIGQARTAGLALLGLPESFGNVSQLGHNAVHALQFIALRGQAPDDMWLNHLPLLDAFLTLTLIVGIYFYAKHAKASRSRMLGSFFILALLLVAAGGPVTVGIFVPLLYLVIAAGIAYLLHVWLGVFPRNPVARGVGIAIVSVAVASSVLYGVRQYFVAWPHHPETKLVFSDHKFTRSHL